MTDGSSPLHLVAWAGQLDIARHLLDRGADTEAKDERGISPLHNAASIGHLGTVRYLLGGGAEIGAKDTRFLDGNTAKEAPR